MFGTKMARSYLDAKLCFDLWIETGSVYKTRLVLRDKYKIFNPKNGKMPSQMGVWSSAARYMLQSPEDARKQVEQVWRANGEILSDEEWNKMLYERAMYIFRKKKLNQYFDEHPELRKYKHEKPSKV